MRGIAVFVAVLSGLSACGAPPEQLPSLSGVDLRTTGASLSALPDQTEPSATEQPALAATAVPEIRPDNRPRRGLLGFLQREADTALGIPLAGPTGETDGAAPPDVVALDAGRVPEAAETPEGGDAEPDLAGEAAPRPGLFGLFRRPVDALDGESGTLAETAPAIVVAEAEAEAEAKAEAEAEAEGSEPLLASVAEPKTDAAPRAGLFGFLRPAVDETDRESADRDAAALADEASEAEAVAPVLAALPAPQADTGPRRGPFGGLFGGGRASREGGAASSELRDRGPRPDAPDYRVVTPGTTLPYGEIARLCGVSGGRLGRKVEQYPARGGTYKLYDSAPGDEGLRSFYVTGFEDGCARQFSAALVIFGNPEIYEQIRYGLAGETQPVAETDRAYEDIKSRVCKVRRGKPCGAQMSNLSKDTVFLSIYERFGTNARWKNLLLHDGRVVALDLKSR